MTEQPSDADLLARHAAGDPDAFGILVRRHRDRLWAVALRTLGDREEAADALQDALVSAYRAAHTFEGRSQVTTWLHRIVVNACLDRARRAATRRAGSLDAHPQQLDAALGSAEPADSPVVRDELRREVVQALATLPADQRAALVLVDMQGHPVAEAAAMLGVPVGTVKSRCARGRARLLPLVRHLRDGGDTRPEGDQAPVSRETPPRGAAATAPVSRETPGTPGGSGHPPHGTPRGTAGGATSPRASLPPEGNPSGSSPVPGTGSAGSRHRMPEGDVTTR
ncbi:RNA polymerase sigma factor SigM [Kitasatospora paranensis]|uniref:RNA polymerase sigma factor SigM n=1 Tax=Kitasatospora paranensis TaxID=258053 RepID=A0ABW2G1A1_9ACTN